MNKGLYALAGVIFALVVSSIIGQFFSGLMIGLVIGYSICDKGEMATAVWTKLHSHIDMVFARLILLAGLKLEDYHERDDTRLPSKDPSSSKLTNLKVQQPTQRRKRADGLRSWRGSFIPIAAFACAAPRWRREGYRFRPRLLQSFASLLLELARTPHEPEIQWRLAQMLLPAVVVPECPDLHIKVAKAECFRDGSFPDSRSRSLF